MLFCGLFVLFVIARLLFCIRKVFCHRIIFDLLIQSCGVRWRRTVPHRAFLLIFCFFLGSKDEFWTFWINAESGNKYCTLNIIVMFLLLIDPSLAIIQMSIIFQGDLTPINRPGWHHDITLLGLWRSQALSFSIHDCIASCRGVDLPFLAGRNIELLLEQIKELLGLAKTNKRTNKTASTSPTFSQLVPNVLLLSISWFGKMLVLFTHLVIQFWWFTILRIHHPEAPVEVGTLSYEYSQVIRFLYHAGSKQVTSSHIQPQGVGVDDGWCFRSRYVSERFGCFQEVSWVDASKLLPIWALLRRWVTTWYPPPFPVLQLVTWGLNLRW